MGDSSEETQIGRERKENILPGRLRTQGHALRTKGLGLGEAAGDHHSPPARERTDVAPCDVAIELHISGPIDRAWGQPVLDPRLSDRAWALRLRKGTRRDDVSHDKADSIESAIGLLVLSGNESTLTQHNEVGSQVEIDSHTNGSEETRDASCRKGDDRTAHPAIRVKGGT